MLKDKSDINDTGKDMYKIDTAVCSKYINAFSKQFKRDGVVLTKTVDRDKHRVDGACHVCQKTGHRARKCLDAICSYYGRGH
jgi:hypothetical protein